MTPLFSQNAKAPCSRFKEQGALCEKAPSTPEES